MTSSQSLNPIAAAFFATASSAFLISAASSCSFLMVAADSGQFLVVEDDAEPNHNINSTSLGIFCQGDLYDLDGDAMWRMSVVLSCFSIVFSVLATTLSWAIATFFRPSFLAWKTISVISGVTAALQVLVFLVFEANPCSDYKTSQSCSMDTGSFYLVTAIICSITVTLITQCLDPPLWAIAEDQGKAKNTLDATVSDASHSTVSHSFEFKQFLWTQSILKRVFPLRSAPHGHQPSHDKKRQTEIDEDSDFGSPLPDSAEQEWAYFPRSEVDSDESSTMSGRALLSNQTDTSGIGLRFDLSPIAVEEVNPCESYHSYEGHPVFIKSVKTKSVDMRAALDCANDQLNGVSWGDEEGVCAFHTPWENETEDFNISGNESILDGVYGDESILDGSITYLEDWTVEEVVTKVLKREDHAKDPPPPSLALAHSANMAIHSNFQSQEFDEPRAITRGHRVMADSNDLKPITPYSGFTRESIQPSSSGKTSDNLQDEDEPAFILSNASKAWTPLGRGPNTGYNVLFDDECELFSGKKNTGIYTESSYPPPIDVVTVEDVFGHRAFDELAIEPANFEEEELIASWNDIHRTGISSQSLTREGESQSMNESLPISVSGDEHSSEDYLDPDLSLDVSVSDTLSDSHKFNDEYSRVVVSEVIRRQQQRKKRRKKRRSRSGSSVHSAPSLLDTTIYEETPSDVESEESQPMGEAEDYDPYGNGSLTRRNSAPNLHVYGGLANEAAHRDGPPINKHRVETWRHAYSADDQHVLASADDRHVLGAPLQDGDDESGVVVSESKSDDYSVKKVHLSLFKEERVLRKDLHSIIAYSDGMDEWKGTSPGESSVQGLQTPLQVRVNRIQRLQDSRFHDYNKAQSDKEQARTSATIEAAIEIINKRNAALTRSLPLEQLSTTVHLSQTNVELSKLRSYQESCHVHSSNNAKPDGLTSRPLPEVTLTPSFEGSI